MRRVYVCVWETQGECVYFRVWLTALALWTKSLTAAPDTWEFLVTSFWCDFKPIYTLIKEWNQWVKTKQFLPADSIGSLPSAIPRTCWSRGLQSCSQTFLKVWHRPHSRASLLYAGTKHDDYQHNSKTITSCVLKEFSGLSKVKVKRQA